MITNTNMIFYDFSNQYRYRYIDISIVSVKSIGLSLFFQTPHWVAQFWVKVLLPSLTNFYNFILISELKEVGIVKAKVAA